MKNAKRFASIKVADEVWIATALLHRENPKREDFSVSESSPERVERICPVSSGRAFKCTHTFIA
jgi:hypothetical protein